MTDHSIMHRPGSHWSLAEHITAPRNVWYGFWQIANAIAVTNRSPSVSDILPGLKDLGFTGRFHKIHNRARVQGTAVSRAKPARGQYVALARPYYPLPTNPGFPQDAKSVVASLR